MLDEAAHVARTDGVASTRREQRCMYTVHGVLTWRLLAVLVEQLDSVTRTILT